MGIVQILDAGSFVLSTNVCFAAFPANCRGWRVHAWTAAPAVPQKIVATFNTSSSIRRAGKSGS